MSQLFGFPSGLSGGSKETTYNTNRSTTVNTNYNSQFTSYFNTNAPASRSTTYVTTGNQHLVRYNGTLHEYDSNGDILPMDWPSFGETTGGFAYWFNPNYNYSGFTGAEYQFPTSLVVGNSPYDYLSNMEFRSQAWGHLGDWYSYNSSSDSYFYNEFMLWSTGETHAISDIKNNYKATRVGGLKSIIFKLERAAWLTQKNGQWAPANNMCPWLVLDENPSTWRIDNDRYDINYFKNYEWNGSISNLATDLARWLRSTMNSGGQSKTMHTYAGSLYAHMHNSRWWNLWPANMYFVYEMDLERKNASWNYSANTNFTTNYGTSKLTQKNTDRNTAANTTLTTSHITYG